jgi:hypothetical protein
MYFRERKMWFRLRTVASFPRFWGLTANRREGAEAGSFAALRMTARIGDNGGSKRRRGRVLVDRGSGWRPVGSTASKGLLRGRVGLDGEEGGEHPPLLVGELAADGGRIDDLLTLLWRHVAKIADSADHEAAAGDGEGVELLNG